MGIPICDSKEHFNSYAAGVEYRLNYRRPWAFGIGAVYFNQAGALLEAIFPQINIRENFLSAAAFADVTHHRCGNAVRPLGFWELKELEGLFEPFLEETGHANVDAYKEVRRLVCKENMQGVVVFIQHHDDRSCEGHPVFDAFRRKLEESQGAISQQPRVSA